MSEISSVIVPKILRQTTDAGTFAILNESLRIKSLLSLYILALK